MLALLVRQHCDENRHGRLPTTCFTPVVAEPGARTRLPLTRHAASRARGTLVRAEAPQGTAARSRKNYLVKLLFLWRWRCTDARCGPGLGSAGWEGRVSDSSATIAMATQRSHRSGTNRSWRSSTSGAQSASDRAARARARAASHRASRVSTPQSAATSRSRAASRRSAPTQQSSPTDARLGEGDTAPASGRETASPVSGGVPFSPLSSVGTRDGSGASTAGPSSTPGAAERQLGAKAPTEVSGEGMDRGADDGDDTQSLPSNVHLSLPPGWGTARNSARSSARAPTGSRRSAASETRSRPPTHPSARSAGATERTAATDAEKLARDKAMGLIGDRDDRAEELADFVAHKIQEKYGNRDSLTEVYRSWDDDGDGVVDKHEFRNVLEACGIALDDEDMDLLFWRYDTNGSGKLDFGEYTREVFDRYTDPLKMPRGRRWKSIEEKEAHEKVMAARRADKETTQLVATLAGVMSAKYGDSGANLRKMLKNWDEDHSGGVELGEFRRILKLYGLPFTDHQVAKLHARFDAQNNNTLDYNEFLSAVFQVQKGPSGGNDGFAGPDREREMERMKQFADSMGVAQRKGVKMKSADEVIKLLRARYAGNASLATIFRSWDKDGSATLSPDELRRGLNKIGIFTTSEELAKLATTVGDGDIELSFDEVMTLIYGDHLGEAQAQLAFDGRKKEGMTEEEQADFDDFWRRTEKVLQRLGPVEETRRTTELQNRLAAHLADKHADSSLKELFRAFDVNHDGSVSYSEMREVVRSFNLGFSKEDIDLIIARADRSRDGDIDYEEFAREFGAIESIGAANKQRTGKPEREEADDSASDSGFDERDDEKTEDLWRYPAGAEPFEPGKRGTFAWAGVMHADAPGAPPRSGVVTDALLHQEGASRSATSGLIGYSSPSARLHANKRGGNMARTLRGTIGDRLHEARRRASLMYSLDAAQADGPSSSTTEGSPPRGSRRPRETPLRRPASAGVASSSTSRSRRKSVSPGTRSLSSLSTATPLRETLLDSVVRHAASSGKLAPSARQGTLCFNPTSRAADLGDTCPAGAGGGYAGAGDGLKTWAGGKLRASTRRKAAGRTATGSSRSGWLHTTTMSSTRTSAADGSGTALMDRTRHGHTPLVDTRYLISPPPQHANGKIAMTVTERDRFTTTSKLALSGKPQTYQARDRSNKIKWAAARAERTRFNAERVEDSNEFDREREYNEHLRRVRTLIGHRMQYYSALAARDTGADEDADDP